MFEIPGLSGTRETSIILQTRLGNDVENAQSAEPDDEAISKFRELHAKFPNWELRKEACGTYNCFGHVWAARRTAIYNQSDVETILRDDGYRKLGQSEEPVYGDIVLYYDELGDYLYHAGLVWEHRQSLILLNDERNGASTPWILSKLDDTFGEVLHSLMDVNYPKNFVTKFFTDRPIEGTP